MPRPRKCRRVCLMPSSTNFGPLDTDDSERPIISMGVDEFEAIRLIDLEELTQEEAAERMNVARTTAQAIYTSARKKLAECLVSGKDLRIDGGDYRICDEQMPHCGCQNCHKIGYNK